MAIAIDLGALEFGSIVGSRTGQPSQSCNAAAINGADTGTLKSEHQSLTTSPILNKTLSTRPVFGDDHFIYRTPRWVETLLSILSLSIAGFLIYLALSINSISSPLTAALWLASGILIVIALRRRPEEASIYFVCDHGGIYFPSSRARSMFVWPNETPWLHVPWRNISDIRIQLLLDEAANRKGVVFSIAATVPEVREFLSRHGVFKTRNALTSGAVPRFLVGFSSLFHRHDEVTSHLGRFQRDATAPPSSTD